MPCQDGWRLQLTFEDAVAARNALEMRIGPRLESEVKNAQKEEDSALLRRAMHVSRCRQCWIDPPHFTGNYRTVSPRA
jgi:hypothetical protein